MRYPSTYSDFHAGKWRDGESPISDKFIMHVRCDQQNHIYVIEERLIVDFLYWVMQVFMPQNSQEDWIVCNIEPDNIIDALKSEGIEVRQTYLANVV
jgi:hypothetical protein